MKTPLELKGISLEFHSGAFLDEKAVISDEGHFEGYLSTFGNVDDGGDIVMPGAFAKCLAVKPVKNIKLLWQHKADEPIGYWKTLIEDRNGLKCAGQLDLNVNKAREVLSLVKNGAVDGLSIGYRAIDVDFEPRSGVRKLKEIDLFEGSIVTFAMNSQAGIASAKEFNPRELEKGLREEGFSRSDAVKAVAVFRKHLRDAGGYQSAERDAGRDEIADAIKRLREMRG